MAAEEVLGISGQMDISDIQASLDKLCNQLDKVGVNTESLSQRMTTALNDIAKSDGNLSSKTVQAMNVLKMAMEEAANGIKIVPEMIDTANKRVETIYGTIEKLNTQLSQVEKGSNAFDAITKQIDSQKQALQINQEDARLLASSYNEVKNSIAQMSGAYQALEAMSVASSAANTMDAAASGANTVAKTANSVASAINAASTSSEGVAHADNAIKLGQETGAILQNNSARQQQQEVISAEEQMYGRLISKLQEGSLSEEQYQRIVEQETASLEEQRRALNELSQQRAEHNSRPLGNGYELDAQGNITNSADVEKWQAETQAINQQYEVQKKTVEDSQKALNDFVEAHNRLAKSQESVSSTTEKSQEINSQEIKNYKQLETEIDNLEKKISGLQQQKQNLLSIGGGFSIPSVPADALANSGVTFGSERLENLRALNQEISTTKEKLEEAKEKLQAFQQIGEEAPKVSFANYTEELSNLAFGINDAKQRLADYEAQYNKLANKDNLTAKQRQELEDLGQKIDETKKQIQDLQSQLREKNEETFIGILRVKLSDVGAKISEFGNKVEGAILSPLNKLGEKISNSSFSQRFGAELTQAKAGLDDFKNGVVGAMTANGKFQAQIGVISEAFKGLGIPVTGSLTAIKSVTKALWAMCATPVGAVIAAVALAFKAVYSWMTKSKDGQLVYTKLMAYFGSLAKSVTDIVIIFGEYLYNCFTKPKGPLNDFGKNFVKTFKTAITAVVNLLGGLGTTIKGVLNFDWDTFTSGLKKTWDGLKGAGETIVDAFKTGLSGAVGTIKTAYDAFTNDGLGNKLENAFNGMLSKATQAATLAGQIKDKEIGIAKNKEKQAELDAQIAEERNKIYTLQGKEKIAAIETTKELIKQKYDDQIKKQQELVELSEKNAKLHTKSLEDIAKERELRIQVLRTQAQMASEQRMLTRQEESTKRSLDSQEKSATKKAQNAAKKDARQEASVNSASGKLNEVIYENEYARAKAELELEGELTDARIKAMEEGEEKVLAERNRELQKEIEQIEQRKEAAIKAERDRQKAEFDARQTIVKAKGGKAEQWDENNIDKEPIKKISSLYEKIERVTIEASNQKSIEDAIGDYKTEAQKRLDIEKKFNNDIAILQEARVQKEKELNAATSEEQKTKLQKQIDNLTLAEGEAVRQKGENLMSFDFDKLKKMPEYTQAFEDLKATSTETLTHLISLFSQFKQKAGEALKPEDLREYMNTLQQMQDEILSRGDNPYKQVVITHSELTNAKDEVKNIEKYIKTLDKQGNKTKETIALEKKLSKIYKTREEAEEALRQAKDKVIKKQQKYNKAVKEVREGIQKLSDSISNLGSTIGGTEGKILQLIGNVLSFVTTSSEGIEKVAQTGATAISTIEKASVILTIISAAIQLMQELDSLIPDAHKQYESYAAEIKEVNDLTDAVNDYTIAALEAQQAKEKWFATSDLNDLKDAYELSGEALDTYYKKLTQAQAVYENESGEGWLTKATKWISNILDWTTPFGLINKGLEAIGLNDNIFQKIANWSQAVTGVAGAGEHILASYIKSENYQEGTTAAVNNLRIETRKRSKGFLGTGIGGHAQETEDLTQWIKENYGEDLFDQAGLINIELANNVLDKYGDKLVGETKETLEELVELRKKYDEFKEKVEEYVSDAFSPLTDNLTDALWDWLENGEDVMDKFKEYASDTFADIAKEIVKSSIVSKFYSKFQDAIESAYELYSMGETDEKGLSTSISAATKELMNVVETNIPMLQDLLRSMDEQFQALGMSITGASQSEQTATGKAIEAISEDQASSLVGIGYAMQIALEQGNEMRSQISVDVSFMRAFSEQTANNISEMRDIQHQGLEQLEAINKNTAPIILIREDIASMYKLMKDKY